MKTIKIITLFLCIPFLSKSQLFFSEYSEGSSYNKYLEIFNYSNQTINLSEYVLTSFTNGAQSYTNEFPQGAYINSGDVYVVAASQADPTILGQADYTFEYCCGNGDDAYAIMPISFAGEDFNSINAIDLIGDPTTWQENTGWDVAGVEGATKNHTIVRKGFVEMGNQGNWLSSAGNNENDSEWIVLEQDDWTNLGFHDYEGEITEPVSGCTCSFADNYDLSATIDDGSCLISDSCDDPSAYNYVPNWCDPVQLEYIDQDCQYLSLGCFSDEYACNYFDFDYVITASNMTVMITAVDDSVMDGDVIGAFFVDNNGYIGCGGSIVYEQGSGGDLNIAFAIWGDDASSIEMDGFNEGATMMFLVLRDEQVFMANVDLNTNAPFTNVYTSNGFGQITNIELGDPWEEQCIYPLGGADESCDYTNLNNTYFEEKSIVSIYDFFGRETSLNSQGLKLYIYSDGSVEKHYLFKH